MVENYKVGTLAKYGLGQQDLRALDPRLIYCSITGFGQTGPYAPLPGYDFVFQGMGGLMSITGEPDGQPGAEPMKVGVAVADLMTGMYATVAILGALEHRNVTGQGQYLDIALARLPDRADRRTRPSTGSSAAKRRSAWATATPTSCRTRSSPAKAGTSSWRSANDGQFRSFCKAVGKPQWAVDERFAIGATTGRQPRGADRD